MIEKGGEESAKGAGKEKAKEAVEGRSELPGARGDQPWPSCPPELLYVNYVTE